MESIEPGPGWADAVSKILHEGKKKILSRAIKAKLVENDEAEGGETSSTIEHESKKAKIDPLKKCNHADPIENDLKSIATAGIIQLFNVFKTVNKKSDKKKKRKKKNKLRKRRPTKRKMGGKSRQRKS